MQVQFRDLVGQAKVKSKNADSSTNARNFLNQSYQQYEYKNMENHYERLIDSLEYLTKKSSHVNAETFIKILQNPQRYTSSLLSLCKNLVDLLETQNSIRITHQHYNSQAVLLAIYYKYCHPEKNVKIISSKVSLKNWEKYLIRDKSTDPQSDLKSLLQKQKIQVSLISESYKAQITKNDHILIFDLMNSEFVDYQPLLLAYRNSLTNAQKVILYHSHIQQTQICECLQQIKHNFLQVEAQLQYPIELQLVQKDSEIKEQIIQFLTQQSSHPQKQDIVIFYLSDHLQNSSKKRYLSKLKQSLNEHLLLPQVQFITQSNQILINGKNKIFIVQNVYELLNWNYQYQKVFWVVDYGWNTKFRKDQTLGVGIQELAKQDFTEKSMRMTYIGTHNVGKYLYKEQETQHIKPTIDNAQDLMSYCLRMVDLNLNKFINHQHPRVNACLKILTSHKIIQKLENNQYKILNEQILNLNYKGVDPLQSILIKKCIQIQKQVQKKTLSNLMLMCVSIINSRGSLRLSKDIISQKNVIKPSGIWCKSGYLQSCLQILTRSQIIEQGKNVHRSISRRKTSKVNENQFQQYGTMFQVIMPKAMTFQDMEMEDLLREYHVNQQIFNEIRQKVDDLRDLFAVDMVVVALNNKLIDQIIEQIANVLTNSVIVFSGSRRTGYLPRSAQSFTSILPNRDSLIAQLNESPQFLLTIRCIETQGKKQILMCNNLSIESFMSVFGELPAKKSQSFAQHQIEFHGISSSVFKGLFRNNGIQMKKFEEQFKCFVEPNQQLATIFIYCSKQNGKNVKNAFDNLIIKVKQKYVNYNKIIHYKGNTNVSMSNGGQIKQIIKDNYINRCYLNNLDLEVTNQDLQQLFDQFFVLKQIQLLPAELNKYSKSAIITFNSQKDYYRFHSYYHQCKYFDRLLQVKPIAIKVTAQVNPQMYIDFKWYVWKSHKKAIIVYETQKSAQDAQKALIQAPYIDGSNTIKFQRTNNKIYLNDLNLWTDQIFLEKSFAFYGQIKDVEILKTPLKESSHQQNLIDYLIRDNLAIARNINVQDRYKILQIQKHKNGLRKCRVNIKNIADLNTLLANLNEQKKIMGEGRLYAQSWFSKPILIGYPTAISLYIELLQEAIRQMPNNLIIRHSLKDLGSRRLYLIIKSTDSQTLKSLQTNFNIKLQPFLIELSDFQKNIILSDIGIDNLIDIEQKYQCKLIANSILKKLQIICNPKDRVKIIQQITARVNDKFFYRITLNNKSYRKFREDKDLLETIRTNHFLNLLQVQEFSKTLIFEGSANHVQNALNYMMHLIQSFTVPEQQQKNSELCMICCSEINRPYRLQNCGHKFCFGCLDQYINSILGDMTMFPIKCPQCTLELTIDDLQSLIETGSWAKLINMAANQFVGQRGQIMTFCYTGGCGQINMINLKSFKCDLCTQQFCIQCKQHVHNGLTCQQAKMGSEHLFQKYMQQNGVRTCPNKSCKMPIVRTDGCFRVTCSRCNKSMCFKCDPDKMIPYDDYNDCYKHLNDVHGGYW